MLWPSAAVNAVRTEPKLHRLLETVLIVLLVVILGTVSALWAVNEYQMELTLRGDSELVLEYGTQFQDPGAEARFWGTVLSQEVRDVPYRSVNDGVMHACGHDAHIAMLLMAAKTLVEHKEELHCTVKLVFQPAEEALNGAMKMLDSGLLENLDTVCGMHIFPYIPTGNN